MVRIVAPEHEARALGSGTLVYVTEKHGLVLTNWHVVRDATGPVQVLFPNGFQSAGTVIKTDEPWDLAAIGIWRPNVPPLPMAATPPRVGDLLTIAGYGPGPFRAVSGHCIQYVAPSQNGPSEMIELSAEAREGDSGGPILNRQGQLVGVLLGARDGRTVGSYVGRVDQFLADVRGVMDREAQRTWLALQTPDPVAPLAHPQAEGATGEASEPTRLPAVADSVPPPGPAPAAVATRPLPPPAEIPLAPPPTPTRRPVAARARDGQDDFFRPATRPDPPAAQPSRLAIAPAPDPASALRPSVGASPSESGADDVVLRLTDVIGTSPGQQLRSVLAGIGLISLLVMTGRLLKVDR